MDRQQVSYPVRIAVTGASGVLGRGLAARLLSQGHDVAGIARHRPRKLAEHSRVRHRRYPRRAARRARRRRRGCRRTLRLGEESWTDERISEQVNFQGTQNVLDAMAGAGRIVFVSSAQCASIRRLPKDGIKPGSNRCSRDSGAHWVAIRSALILGRSVDNWVRRVLALPVLADIDGSAARAVQVVHLDDALRLLTRAILDAETDSGPSISPHLANRRFAQIARALGRPVVPLAAMPSDCGNGSPHRRTGTDTKRPGDGHHAAARRVGIRNRLERRRIHVEDFALTVRGRVAFGRRVVSLPWRLANISRSARPRRTGR